MRNITKRAICTIMAVSMILNGTAIPAKAETDVQPKTANSDYIWVNHDRNLEYPAEQTSASANSAQNEYGAERLLDGNTDTRWEASWGNAPEVIDLTLTAQKSEYITGFRYTSRLDNNIGGVMTDYKVYASADGITYDSEPVKEGKILKKLGTFYVVFDEPVKAKSIRISSDVNAASEMRLLYVPSGSDDYDKLLEQAENLRDQAGEKSGMDTGLWLPATLETFDEGFASVKAEGKPESDQNLYEADRKLFELIRDLKRAQLESTVELNAQLRTAETLLRAAVVGTKPMSWEQKSIDKFQKIVTEVQNTAGNQVAGTGIVADGKEKLEEGGFVFKAEQVKPQITYTGTVMQSLDHMMDGLTESHFQGKGTGETIYFELDYKDLYQFESLTFQTWFASVQNIRTIKVQYKDVDGNWQWVDSGRSYTMNWTTNTNQSESHKVSFETPVKGSALRIYVMEGSNAYVIDELTVGISVDEADMQIYLDQEAVTLREGETLQLNATVLPANADNKNVTWSSSDSSIVSVSKDGLLTAGSIPEGQQSAQATVTATTEYGNKSAVCKITVNPKTAEASDKEATTIRIKNARKLAEAAKETDYQENAITEFKSAISKAEQDLAGNVTVGQIQKIDSQIKVATEQFASSSLITIRETRNLIDRITGEGSNKAFEIEMISKDPDTGMDVYEVDYNADTKKIVLRGNNGVSLATAYNYYLKYYAYLDFPYVGECNLQLPDPLPTVSAKVRIVFPYEYRHYFNENCEYKYTTSLYTEEEWQHRIDWMAMNGFNMFLLDLGERAIWYNAKDELGLNEEALNELRHYSNGSEQYFGKYEISQQAIEQEGVLARKVTEMAFKAGMEPEIRPFVGQVPFMFPEEHDDYYGTTSKAKMTVHLSGSLFDGMYLYSAARWMNLPQGVFISPEVEASDSANAEEMKAKFAQISNIYYESLMETLGFNEWGRTPVYGYKDLIGEQGFVVSHAAFPRKVLKEMSDQLLKLNPDAIWMQTSWRYQEWLTEYYEEGHLMFVDLSADNRPKWNTNNEFGQTPWLWSMLYNFGGNSGMGGGMDHIAENVIDTKTSSNYMKGVAITPEGGDTNPALYGLMAEMTWRSEKPDVNQWIRDYTKRRYGAENYEKAQTEIDEAWDILHNTVYSAFVSGDGPSQTLVNAYPKLSGAISRVYGSNDKVYETAELIPAWEKMLAAAKKMDQPTEQFLYDLTDLTRQVLGDISGEVYACIKPAYDTGDKEKALYYTDLMIQICEDMDEILATNKAFMAGTRLADARSRGVTESDKNFYEKVERTFMTYWILDDAEKGTQGLMDYCNRHLSGLMTDYYEMRWKVFRKYLEEGLDSGLSVAEFNAQKQPEIKNEIIEKMTAWTNDTTPYATQPTGDTVKVSEKLWNDYQEIIEKIYGIVDASNDISVDKMTATAGNEQAASGAEGPASNVLDGDSSTIWHTSWNGSEREEQYIVINLNEAQPVNGLRYLPRQGGGVNGIITKYAIDISNDGGQTYTQVAEGTWDGDTLWKKVQFESVVATNVKLRVLDARSTGNLKFASAAEIRIMQPDKGAEIPQPDKTKLAALIAYARGQQEAMEYQNVVKAVKEALEQALANAEEVNASEMPTQDEIDSAYAGLLEKVHMLGYIGNSEELGVLVDVISGMNLDIYTDETKAALQEALQTAKELLEKENVLQDELDAAKKALQTARDNLEKKIVNKDKLKKLVEEASSYESKINGYTAVTADILAETLQNAREVIDDEDVTQEDVDQAYENLLNAIFGLREIPSKEKLQELIDKAAALDLSEYTDESVMVLTSALKQAKAVVEDKDADQEAVTDAEQLLTGAIEQLARKADAADGKNNSGANNGTGNSDSGQSTVTKKDDSPTANSQGGTTDVKGNGAGSDSQKTKAAKTGDTSVAAVWLLVMILAAGTVLVTGKKKYRK